MITITFFGSKNNRNCLMNNSFEFDKIDNNDNIDNSDNDKSCNDNENSNYDYNIDNIFVL